MDSFSMSYIKQEKAKAIKKHRKLQKIANVFRLIEICLFLALISRFSIQLPVAVKNSGAYFKDLTVTLASPRFVFILGNVIVMTLYANSGQFSSQDSSVKNSRSNLYDDFVEKSGKNQGMQCYLAEYREKQSTSVKRKITEDTSASLRPKNYKRSQSEKFGQSNCNKCCRKLRRSVTEKCRKSQDSGKGRDEETSRPEDDMSNEEFRCAIEAFIARQKRFTRDEELCVID